MASEPSLNSFIFSLCQVNKTMRELNHPGARSPSRTGTPPVGGRNSPALKDAPRSPGGDGASPAVNKPLAAAQAAGRQPRAGSPLHQGS